jgi:hypothetical protein
MSFLSPEITTFIAHETIPAGARVKLVSGSAMRVELADAADNEIGTAILFSGKSSYAPDTEVGVKLIYSDGTRTALAASGSVTAGGVVYRAADGKVSHTGSDIFGYALEASAADGDPIEVLYAPAGADNTPADGSVTTTKLAADAVTVEKLATALKPSHVIKLAQIFTMGGGDAAEAETLTGVAATDIVLATIVDNASNDDVVLLEAKPTTNTVTFLFSEDPGAGVKVSVAVIRPIA